MKQRSHYDDCLCLLVQAVTAGGVAARKIEIDTHCLFNHAIYSDSTVLRCRDEDANDLVGISSVSWFCYEVSDSGYS
jgi:hypothetical protein